MAVFGHQCWYSCRVLVFGQKMLYSCKVVVFGIRLLYPGKSGCSREKEAVFGKVAVFGQKWL